MLSASTQPDGKFLVKVGKRTADVSESIQASYFSFYSFICLAFFIMRIGSSNLLVLYQGWSNACDTLGT